MFNRKSTREIITAIQGNESLYVRKLLHCKIYSKLGQWKSKRGAGEDSKPAVNPPSYTLLVQYCHKEYYGKKNFKLSSTIQLQGLF